MKEFEILRGGLADSCDELLNVKKISFDGTPDEIINRVGDVVADIARVCKSIDDTSVSIPRVTYRVRGIAGDSTTRVSVLVRTALTSETACSNKLVFELNDSLLENICMLFINTIGAIYLQDCAVANLKAFEERLGEVLYAGGAEVPYDLGVELSESPLVKITDKEIVYGIGLENAINIKALSRLNYTGDGEFLSTESYAVDEILGDMNSSCNTVTFLQKCKYFRDLIGVKQMRADILIRKSVHKKAEFVTDGVGYISSSITEDGEDIPVFALVEKARAEDGEVLKNVVLKPFRVDSLLNVDLDVIGK